MIISNVNTEKLHKEFISVGINPYPVFRKDNGESEFTFPPNTDMEIVQQIIDAHDVTPIATPLTELEKLRLEQAQANTELVQLILMMGGA